MIALCTIAWFGIVAAVFYKSDGRSWGGERLVSRMFYWLFVAIITSVGTRRRFWGLPDDLQTAESWQVAMIASATLLAADVSWSFLFQVLVRKEELGSVLGYAVVLAALVAPISIYIGSRRRRVRSE